MHTLFDIEEKSGMRKELERFVLTFDALVFAIFPCNINACGSIF